MKLDYPSAHSNPCEELLAVERLLKIIVSSCGQPLDDVLSFRAIELLHSVAFQFRRDASGATALFAPSVGELTEQLRDAVQDSDVVFFDGTFWSDGELVRVRPGARSARRGGSCHAAEYRSDPDNPHRQLAATG